MPKNNKPSCLNDYRPVALTSIVMKVFERLVKSHISSSILVTLDPLQFAYRPNRSTDDAISHILHSSLTHIDSSNGNFARLLFIDYSSSFNTIVPIKLTSKLTGLGLNTSLCDWIQDFLTGRPQVVKVGQFTSNSITLNVGALQGCVLSPLLYSLYTHDCVSSHRSTSIIKFADDTVVLGLISNNDETAYLGEVERLTSWCQDNCLSLNVSKTKELIVDFRKRHLLPYTPLMISGTPVERVSSRACERSGAWSERGAERAKYSRSAERVFIQRPEQSLCLAPVPLQYRSHHKPRACTNPPRIHLCLQQLTKLSAYTSNIVRLWRRDGVREIFPKANRQVIQVHNSCQKNRW